MKPDTFAGAQSLLKRVNESLFRDERSADGAAALDADEGERLARAGRTRVALIAGVSILAAGVGVYTLSHTGADEGAKAAEVNRTQAVTVLTADARPFTRRISLQGEARPRRDFQVYAPTNGVRVLEILADEGDMVRAGQPLARLDTAVAQAATRQAEANVAAAEAASQRATDEYERAESIRDSGALSAEAIGQRLAAAVAAEAQLVAARAQLQDVNARMQGGYVRAPAAGLVISRRAEIGRPVDGQMLFRIAGDNALEVAAEIAEADVLALRPGQRASFQLVDGQVVEATMRRGPASIDSRTRTGQALFDLPRGTTVRAGMYLRGEAALAPREALSVPQSSLLYADGQAYVLVMDAQSHARRTLVQTGLRDVEMVEIVSGLSGGEKIIGSGAAFLQDGDPVRVVDQSAAAAATPAGEAE
jgi:RND family efflux transporter MFP subunit